MTLLEVFLEPAPAAAAAFASFALPPSHASAAGALVKGKGSGEKGRRTAASRRPKSTVSPKRRRKTESRKSTFRGVSWHRYIERWQVSCMKKHCGYFLYV